MPEVIHITCNMGSQDLPDMYALSPQALGRQIPPAHVTSYTYTSYLIGLMLLAYNIVNTRAL